MYRAFYLSLYTTVGITSSQSLYLVNSNKVEVAVDSVLQSRGCNSKLKSLALCRLCKQSVDKTT